MYKSILIAVCFSIIAMACNQTQQATEAANSKMMNERPVATNVVLSVDGDTLKKVVKSDKEWEAELNPLEFNVLRQKGTERAFSGDLWDHKAKGTYVCRGCELPLFDSNTKFKSGTGWPSFWQPIKEEYIAELEDHKYGWNRVEVLCARCDGHLGHVFDDGPKPTGLRYCINSVSLDFVEKN